MFFGGGTPSLFQPEDFSRLLGALRQRIAFADDAEITLEANPGTIERGRFAGYRDAGINRVSLGAQTFAPRALEVLGRIHSADDTHRAVAELRAAKLDNFNLDLMYALPRADAGRGARRCANRLCARAGAHFLLPAHARARHGVSFAAAAAAGRGCRLADPNRGPESCWPTPAMRSTRCRRMRETGARCRHNLNYWLFGDYVGIGAGAHGKLSLELPQGILRTDQAEAAARISGADAPRGAGGPRRRERRSLPARTCRSSSC